MKAAILRFLIKAAIALAFCAYAGSYGLLGN